MSNLMNKIKQINALENGGGMQYLLNEGYKILGNPIYVHDIDYKLLSCTENIITDDPLWNELIITGLHGDDTIELFKNEYFIDAVANAKNIAFLASDKLKYSRIIGKILYRNNFTVACANIVACNKPFQDDDPIIFERLCTKFSLEVSKNEYYQIYGETHQETVIKELIEGCINDKRLYTRCVAELYDGLKNYLYIAIADIAKFDPEHARLAYFKNVFKQTYPMFKYAIYSGYIVIIISSDDIKLNIKEDLKELNKLVEEHNICVGISHCFENMFDAQAYYTEAFKALNYGLNSAGSQRIYFYNEIPAYHAE